MRPFDLAMRYYGVKERQGEQDHPLIQWWHELCLMGREQPDEVPWCSAFVNGVAWELRLPRSKKANARSWLGVGTPISLDEAIPGWDIVIFWRGEPDGWKGHVGFFAGVEDGEVMVLGGNQGNEVNLSPYPVDRLLGVRRLGYATGSEL